MLAKVNSSAVFGLEAIPIEVEVDIASQGLPSFTIVGLPDKAVEESKERVRSAIKNTGAEFPAKRITVNLAPADLPKEGPSYDLPIALGILLASGQLTGTVNDAVFIGELSLDGRVRPVKGVLSHTMTAKKRGLSSVYVPSENAKEAAIIPKISIYPVENLTTLLKHFSKLEVISPQKSTKLKEYITQEQYDLDMADIKGQEKVKRAMEIAAAGGHNIILKGPPGAGKTLIARTLPSILPKLTFQEVLEVTNLYSISGLLTTTVITNRPFRSPHHTTSSVGLIGGGTLPIPGEISLAHRGVLFLDEFPEFPRNVLEALRQPIEDGFVTISRSKGKITYPAKTMLVAALNPCPCGHLGSTKHQCICSSSQISRYTKRISGPMLDRIDIHLDVPAVEVKKLVDQNMDSQKESSSVIRKRVQKARDIQEKRFKNTSLITNADLSLRDVKKFCKLSPACLLLLEKATEKMQLSARSYNRMIKLARTIADLENVPHIMPSHIAEALQYRPRFV